MDNASSVDTDSGFLNLENVTGAAEPNIDLIQANVANRGIVSDEASVATTSAEQSITDIITLEDQLRQIFSNCSNNLNVVHINAQSISAHYLALLATFVNLHNIDAVLVSETFLKDSMDTNVGDLPGFKLIRNDRSGKGCGGVAIYLRKELQYEIVDRSPNNYNMSAEYLFIEVFHEETKVLLGVFYSPSSKIDYFSTFENLLKTHRPKYKHCDILGDFNTDLLKRNGRSKKLLSIIDSQDLHILPLGPTHFPPGRSASVLDLIIVCDFANVAKYGQLGSYFSYHDIIYVSKILSPWRERAHPVDIVPESVESKEEPFWQKRIVREALAKQLKASSIYKESGRGENDLKAYQTSREPIKHLETEFKRVSRKNQKVKKIKFM